MLQSVGLQRVKHDLATDQQIKRVIFFLMPVDKLLFSSGTENKLKRMKKNGN